MCGRVSVNGTVRWLTVGLRVNVSVKVNVRVKGLGLRL